MKNNYSNEESITEICELRKQLIRKYLLSNCTSINVPLKNFMNEFEKEMLIRALRISRGSQRIASFILGLKPTTLNEKIRKYNLQGIKKVKGQDDLKALVQDIYISSI